MKTIWSFDLGKASLGEAVRDLSNHSFPHKASLLLPEDFAETRTAASHRRMLRTREAHKAREAWLDAVWRAAGLTPLVGRRVEERDGKWQAVEETQEQKTEREEKLEREFPKKGDVTCYNSALLRIKLLREEKLEPWQIYKALHSAIQKRGYGRVPWAARDERRIEGKSEEELDAALLRKDEAKLTADERVYRETITAWGKFRATVPEPFHYPCYYDAAKMKLWKPGPPEVFSERIDCHAESTRRVRFARADVEKEIAMLARNAAAQLPALVEMFARAQGEGWMLWDEKSGRTKTFPVVATDIGAFLVHGSAGEPLGAAENDFAAYLDFRIGHGIHPGSIDDWMGATAQKTPRFDNRIINDCALLDGHQVCGVGARYDAKNQRPYANSLLASEVTFLMKLKNTLVEAPDKQRKLTPDEVNEIFKMVSKEARAVPLKVKSRGKNKAPDQRTEDEQLKDGMRTWAGRVALRYALGKSDWKNIADAKGVVLRPLKGHEEIKSPKTEGRSHFSRPALRLVRALILSGQKPSDFLRRLQAREPALLEEIGMDILDAEPVRFTGANGKEKKFVKQPRPWVLMRDFKFIADLAKKTKKGEGDTWEALHIPEQRLDALEARHTEDGIIARDAAIREVIGSINDPVVRHRLGVFAGRLRELHARFGVPEEIVLEFIRTDFMGPKAKAELAAFQKKREEARAKAKEQVGKGDALKYELAAAQGFICLYCGQPFKMSELGNYDIDHIVPRKLNGPDAMVNYVLAHPDCNGADGKGEQTPFAWLRPTPGWAAYVERVEACATALRNKKVQLLQREDAPELVERYTALAETAWISRLAQTIAGLHFGWRNGNDFTGPKPVKRVTVISGGLTARVRRKYRLNSLLAPCPAGEDAKEWEAKAEKNRGDDRHHALDAMVINFLPQWSRDASKEHFFRFPDSIQKNAQAFFRKEIDEVMPVNIAFAKPVLAETIYGGRREGEETLIVQRVPLLALGMKPAAQGKTAFDLKYLRDQTKSVREPRIAAAILSFLAEGHDEEAAWRDFCAKLHLPQRDGSPGPRVAKVNVNTGAADEYAEMSKDQTGAFRKGKKGHRGQIVYLLRVATKKGAVKETIKVRPVYVFESRTTVEKKLKDEYGDALTIYGFFQSMCAVALTGEVAHPKTPLAPGTFVLNTIRKDGFVIVTDKSGKASQPISLAKFLTAGFKRVA